MGIGDWNFSNGSAVVGSPVSRYLNSVVLYFVLICLPYSLNWLSASSLEIPIRAQLSSVVYEKNLNLSDVKANVTTTTTANQGAEDIWSESDSDDGSDQNTSKEIQKSIPLINIDHEKKASSGESGIGTSSHQGSINLVAVDAVRVAEFSARSYVLVGITVTLIVAAASLVQLIGWISFGMALLTPLLFTPLNMLASRRYATAQGELMRSRDDKLAVVDEALRGIRHIKFAASESYWEQQIMTVRASELWQQRTVFKWIVVMRLFWISSPILLSVISLGTYGFITGSLTPSIAFTALTIFGNMELALSVIPFAYTQGADALVSSRRLDALLNTKDKREKRCLGSSIRFENAAISWPLPQENTGVKAFTLNNININFKNKKIK